MGGFCCCQTPNVRLARFIPCVVSVVVVRGMWKTSHLQPAVLLLLFPRITPVSPPPTTQPPSSPSHPLLSPDSPPSPHYTPIPPHHLPLPAYYYTDLHSHPLPTTPPYRDPVPPSTPTPLDRFSHPPCPYLPSPPTPSPALGIWWVVGWVTVDSGRRRGVSWWRGWTT